MTTDLTPEFTTSIRGYDRIQVDDYVDTLREWLDTATARMQSAEGEVIQLREQVGRLRQQATELESEANQHPPRSLAAAGDRIARILALSEEGAAAVQVDAEAAANELLARAQRDADERSRASLARQAEIEAWVAQATGQVEQIVGQAEQRAAMAAAQVTSEADARAAAHLAQAEQRATELVQQAQAEAARISEASSAEHARALLEMAAHREDLSGQIRALEAQRDEALAALTGLRESLHRTIGQLPGSPSQARHFVAGEPAVATQADAAPEPEKATAPLNSAQEPARVASESEHADEDPTQVDLTAFEHTLPSSDETAPAGDPDNTVLFDQHASGPADASAGPNGSHHHRQDS
jgi:vacuolar-type H+-ATPase subunit I/STV1